MWQLVWAKCCSSWLKVGKNLQQLLPLPLPSLLIIKRQIVMAAIQGQNTQVLAINNSGSAATSMAINLKVRLYLLTTLSTLAVQHCPPSPPGLSAALSGGSIKRRLTYSLTLLCTLLSIPPPSMLALPTPTGCIMPLTAVISWNIWQANRQAERESQRKEQRKGERKKNINSKRKEGRKEGGTNRAEACHNNNNNNHNDNDNNKIIIIFIGTVF